MKKNWMKKAIMSILSSFIMIGQMSTTVFANDVYKYYCEGNTSQIRWYVTDENEADIIFTQQHNNNIRLNLYFNEGWYFEKWNTAFSGGRNVPNWFDETGINEPNPSYDNYYLFFNVSQNQPFINEQGPERDGQKYLKVDMYPFYGDLRVDAVLRPILTVNAGEGVSYTISTNNPINDKLASNQVAIIYNGNATINYSADSKHVITDVNSNYATNFTDNGSVITVSNIIKPATISINSRLKQQYINFDANGAEGVMATQTFDHSVAQKLTANNFFKTGYTFAGWNTDRNGSGTSYFDKESVMFEPDNDGDSLTLYAQWTQCAHHSYEDGKCTKCGALCSHSGGYTYTVSQNRIVETCLEDCGHIATAEIVRDENVRNMYSGLAIKGLKVVYSDHWQGGNLDIQYADNINSGTASGTITVGDVTAKETFDITKAHLTITARDHTIKYGEEPANNGVEYLGFVSGETESVLNGQLVYDYTYANGDNIGTYEIRPRGLSSDNYDINFIKGQLTVDKADVTYTAPIANNLTYTGTMQELVTAKTVEGGKMVFSFDKEGGYSETLLAKQTGVYTVWYKVIGDDNHYSSAPASITAEIKKVTPDLGTISVSETVYDTTKSKDVELKYTNKDVPGKMSIVNTEEYMRADKTEYSWKFIPDDSDNYTEVYGYIDIDVVDTTEPTASISIDEQKWTNWDKVNFDLFFNQGKKVSIAYADNDTGSGLKDMLYYIADKEMSFVDLENVQWTSYSEAFDIKSDGKYVIYAKAVDNDDNTVIINSDGFVIDKTQAEVNGLVNNGNSYGQLVFTVTDKLTGVKSVVIDGHDKTLFEGQYVINGDNAEHVIVVTDNAGNISEYKVKVYKNYTVTYKVDGKEISTEIVGYGKNATLPDVPSKSGYVGKWDSKGENITSDTSINAVYTAIPLVNPDEVQPSDKNDLEDIKNQLKDMLTDDSYSEEDQNAILSAIDRIDEALNNLDRIMSSLDSPQTGDNNNIMLWFILLSVSVSCLIALLVKRKK